jgi:L-iditol 2-dehydrogenase
LKTVQIVSPSKLALKEVPPPPLADYEVRIEVAFSSVCGSDLKNIADPVKIPQIPGHEFSGRIIETSKASQELFHIGERVTAFPMIACLECAECAKRAYRDCQYKQSLGFQLPGAYAEQVVVDGRFVVPLLNNISYEQGALIEHLCCGYRLVKEISSQIHPSEEVHIVIIGDGPIALADLQALKISLYSNITLIGKHEIRRKIAKKLGASKVVNSVSFDQTKEKLPPVDICIFAADALRILEQVIPLMKPSGIFYPQTRVKSSYIQSLLESHEIFIGRAFAYFLEDFNEMMTLIEAGKIETDSLITARIPLLDVVNVFPAFYEKKNNIKILIFNEDFVSP